MRALDRKLLRDLRLLWSQALTIALVVASGIGSFITSLSAVDSLAAARDAFYAQAHFAELFATVKRAPSSVADQLRAVAGIADVQVTVEHAVRVQVPGSSDPVVGHLIGLDLRRPARMNVVAVSGGRGLSLGPAAGGAIEALVSEGFAQARGIRPGQRVRALINGRDRELLVVGTALSPEYIFAGLFGMPDTRGFGVFWVDSTVLEASFDMQGAFNHVAIKLAPQADEQAAIDGVRSVLQRYGGRDAHGRKEQASHAMLDNEIKEQRVLGTLLPAIFLAVAAFLLNVVVSRLVATQREQIAALKALGYADAQIGWHYLKMVLLIAALGLLLGVALGDWLGTLLTRLYAEIFHLPRFVHRTAPWLVAVSGGIAMAAAALGTLGAVLSTVRLPPAEAMQPPAPGRYGPTLLERMGLRGMPPALRMIGRSMERRALRTVLSIAGVAAALAIVMLGHFFRDAIEVVVDTQLRLGLRGDLTLWSADPLDHAARHDLARLPGVRAVEATRFVSVDLVHGHRRERALLRGYAGRAELYRVVDVQRKVLLLASRDLVLEERLAAKLGVAAGDEVEVLVLEGRERPWRVRVGAVVQEMMGSNAYIEREALNRALGDGDVATGFVLSLDPGHEAQVLDASQRLPRIAGAWSRATMLRNLEEISARNVRIMSTILTIFASVIAVGVVYNSARIALAERAWELASLRVLGFTRAEVSALLLGELAAVVVIALPVGLVLGVALVHGLTELLKTDQFHFPAVVRARTMAWAVVSVVLAGAASAAVVRRRIDRLDMVAALKTRE